MSVRCRCSEQGCGIALNVHDARIIEQLPFDLQLEFPAILTHKYGMSKNLANLLRPCIQNAVGPKKFQKILSELHHLYHDRLELQYLVYELRKRNSNRSYFVHNAPALFSNFNDQTMYAGYVPTAGYIRTFYTTIIETLRPKMEKQTMLLGSRILKGDHSFKFPKHMAKIEETSIFTALYTVTNEYEEIIHQVLVPSKPLSYL